ncbi:MAG: heavy metal-responsive transcriptional regulator [Sinimarinibacterium sp.]|jgi:Hg(II)-responsive transcriptional regulator
MKEFKAALTVGALAKAAGVGVPTLRYYERRGLLPPPRRRQSGYREYSADAVRHVRFIRHAQQLGFSLSEVEELLSLQLDPRHSCADVRTRAQRKIADIASRVENLNRMRRVLERLVEACPGDAPIRDCPILDALDDEHDTGR